MGLQAKTGSSDTSPVAVLGSGVEPSQRLGFHVRDARRRWPWGGDTLCPVSPRGEALFRCARPSGVPRGPATSTGSLASTQMSIFCILGQSVEI